MRLPPSLCHLVFYTLGPFMLSQMARFTFLMTENYSIAMCAGVCMCVCVSHFLYSFIF